MKQSDVVYTISHHGQSFQTKAKSKTGIFFRINPAGSQNIRMHHAGAAKFHPAGVFAHPAALALAKRAGQINFKAWLHKRKVARPDSGFKISSEYGFDNGVKHRLEVGNGNILIYH